MATTNDLVKLKADLDRLRTEASRAEGALAQVMGRLESEHGCDTIEAAEKKLVKLTQKEEEAKVEFDRAFKKFKTEHGDLV